MIEEGTLADFKHCILDQLWIWQLKCGHTVISHADFRTEFELFQKDGMHCPHCVSDQPVTTRYRE
jgi:hypothetical protein